MFANAAKCMPETSVKKNVSKKILNQLKFSECIWFIFVFDVHIYAWAGSCWYCASCAEGQIREGD